jgi:hypothetical protein
MLDGRDVADIGRPVDATLSAWVALAEVYLDRADEARALAHEIGVAQP